MGVQQGRPGKWGAKDALDFRVPTLKMGRTIRGLLCQRNENPAEYPSQTPLGVWTGALVHCSCQG